RLNSPLIALPVDAAPDDHSFVEASGLPVGLGALKPAFDANGAVLRIYEPHGSRGRVRLTFSRVVTAFETVNLLEESESRPGSVEQVSPVVLDADLRPFEILSLRLSFGD
ncbi:MAG: glycosyl hydrolase-related protein, partial [Thermomicrobiales bacterium]